MTCLVRIAWVVGCGLSFGALASCADGADLAAAAPGDDANAAGRIGRASAGYTQTRYPIVLAHGMGGWQELFGVIDYFYDLPAQLRAGGATVYVTSVSAFASTEARGEQLLEQVEYIAAASGAGKLNLIGHSQGGLDVRYVLAARPDLVASVTTVAGPHGGAPLADWLLENTTSGGFTQTVVSVLADGIGLILDLLSGTDHPQDAMGAIEQVTVAGMADFNARYPAGLPSRWCGNGAATWNGVHLYSWAGAGKLTNLLDPTDAPLGLASLEAGSDTDGLVPQCAAHFGTVLRDDYNMNHLDEVNQVLGLTSLFETSPVTVFRAHANRLRNAGL
jgi:triacylglycerol lipase